MAKVNAINNYSSTIEIGSGAEGNGSSNNIVYIDQDQDAGTFAVVVNRNLGSSSVTQLSLASAITGPTNTGGGLSLGSDSFVGTSGLGVDAQNRVCLNGNISVDGITYRAGKSTGTHIWTIGKSGDDGIPVGQISAIGAWTKPLQPAFLTGPNGNILNVTGDATDYTAVWATEVFDQNADFDGTSTFTAPVAGKYLLNAQIGLAGIISTHTQSLSTITTSNRGYNKKFNPFDVAEAAQGIVNLTISSICDMDASDTATVTIRVSNGTKVVDFTAVGGGLTNSYFSGCLLA